MKAGIQKINRDIRMKAADDMQQGKAMGLKGRADKHGFAGRFVFLQFLCDAISKFRY